MGLGGGQADVKQRRDLGVAESLGDGSEQFGLTRCQRGDPAGETGIVTLLAVVGSAVLLLIRGRTWEPVVQ